MQAGSDARPAETTLLDAFDYSGGSAIDPQGLVKPLVALLTGAQTSSELQNLTEVAVVRCMAAVGHHYVARRYSGSAPLTVAALVEIRAEYGYGLVTNANGGESDATDPNADSQAQMSVQERSGDLDVLEGRDRVSGCRAAADAEVYGRLPAAMNPNELGTALGEMSSDTRVLLALSNYVRCMSAAGDSGVTSPDSVAGVVMERASLANDPTSVESAVAEAEVACSQAGLWQAWQSVETPLAAEVKASQPG